MFFGTIIARKRYSLAKYFYVFLIIIGERKFKFFKTDGELKFSGVVLFTYDPSDNAEKRTVAFGGLMLVSDN